MDGDSYDDTLTIENILPFIAKLLRPNSIKDRGVEGCCMIVFHSSEDAM